jgi:hypothetical protein
MIRGKIATPHVHYLTDPRLANVRISGRLGGKTFSTEDLPLDKPDVSDGR